ncbi:MAG: hypothetical protein AAGF25_11635 [Pseudomonadota bacterium]
MSSDREFDIIPMRQFVLDLQKVGDYSELSEIYDNLSKNPWSGSAVHSSQPYWRTYTHPKPKLLKQKNGVRVLFIVDEEKEQVVLHGISAVTLDRLDWIKDPRNQSFVARWADRIARILEKVEWPF